jgi:hypothetical protein
MKNLVVCQKNESLECFLARAKGWKCPHSIPHKYDQECCGDTICCFIGNTKLLGCICKSYKENIESA